MKGVKFLTLMLASSMALMSAIPVRAMTITVDGNASQYEAYRLFDLTTSLKAGDTHNDGEHTGDCYNYAYSINPAYVNLVKALDVVKNADANSDGAITDTEIIEYVGSLDAPGIRSFADAAYKAIKAEDKKADLTSAGHIFTTEKQGYYLIAESTPAADPDSVSLVMLDTAGAEDIKVSAKEDVPVLTKKIADTNKETMPIEASALTDAVDAKQGEDVRFVLTGTMPENIGNYSTYKYIFHDTLSDGLSLKADSIRVYADNTLVSSDKYTVAQNAEDCTFEVAFDDILTACDGITKDSEITVVYTASVTAQAVSGNTGNPNDAHLEFSSNPYTEGSTSTTPDDTVKVFQFTVVINKVDGSKNPLTGAEFTLYKQSGGNWDAVDTLTVNDAGTTFTFSGLDQGTYKLEESKVPSGYNKADDMVFEIAAVYDTEATDPQITSFQIKQNGSVVSEGEDATFEISSNKGTATGSVINSSGIQLPHTGEMGRAILLYGGIGAIVISMAAAAMASKKKKA